MSLTTVLASFNQALRRITLGSKTRHLGKRRSLRRFQPELEPLEARELMASAIGMNLEPVGDYMGAWMFTDAFRASRPWTRTTDGRPDLGIALDRQGNPVQLATGQQVNTVMFSSGREPAGTYTAWWRGAGTVQWYGDVDPATIQLSTAIGSDGLQYHAAQFSVTPTGNGIQMAVTPSSAVDINPIHDVHVWMPDYNGQHFAGQIWHAGAAFSPFHPLFLERLAPFHTLRFKQLQETDNSSLQHWADRRAVDYETQQSAANSQSVLDDGLVRGQSTNASTANTLTDSSPWTSWSDNQWAGLTVQIISGAGVGQVRTIVSNTGNQLTLDAAWDQAPDSTSSYAILVRGPQAGRSTGGNTATTLNDLSQRWATNQWAGMSLRITSGAGAGQTRAILSNTSSQLVLGTPWITTSGGLWTSGLDATLPDAASTYAIESIPGIAPEYMVELANELHADAWISIPHMAQDDYIRGLANLVHNSLNPTQRVYLEWSNEAFLFDRPNVDPYQWIASQVGAGWENVAPFAAHQAAHAFDIWSQAFADRPGQLVRVAGGFAGNTAYNDPLLAAMGGNFDAFAVAPYFGPGNYTGITTVSQILDAVSASITPTLDDLRVFPGDFCATGARNRE